MQWIDRIFELFATFGDRDYAGEPVTQTEHALQTATLAEQAHASNAMVTAALLHDIGHLLHFEQQQRAEIGADTVHEYRACAWLRAGFGPEVTELIRLHVDAKRYLCTAEPGYLETLSPASLRSLGLQGGPMGMGEARAFKSRPFAEEAIELRRWDEAAKRPRVETPGLEHFRAYLEAALRDARKVL